MPTSSPTASGNPVVGFGLPRTARLRHNREFRAVYRRGVRAHGPNLVVVALRQTPPQGHRIGLAVSKQNGRAVRRNKIKRLFREAFRLTRAELPGAFDMVLIPQKQTQRHKYDLVQLRSELLGLVRDLDRRPRRRKRKAR